MRISDWSSDVCSSDLIAQTNGLLPAVTVAQVLESALAEGERGALIHGWLSILHDAIRCDRFDRPACDAYAAACSVRDRKSTRLHSNHQFEQRMPAYA